MLEHVPHWLGAALGNVRAGAEKLVIAGLDPAPAEAIHLSSLAFADGARLPDRFTADGEGLSPPLAWSDPPTGTDCLLLLVEDPDAPAPQPLVHAVVTIGDLALRSLDEGAIRADGDGDGASDSGRNSFFREGWLPPDPPTGHGTHHYVFQLFALGPGDPVDHNPGRSTVLEALAGRPILAAGALVGTYSRGEPADIGPVGSAVPAG